VPLGEATVAAVGTGWHRLALEVVSDQLRLAYDGDTVLSVRDIGYEGRPVLPAGGVSVELWREGRPASIQVEDLRVRAIAPYRAYGHLISPTIDAGAPVSWRWASWQADTPPGTSVRLRVRAASTRDGLADAS